MASEVLPVAMFSKEKAPFGVNFKLIKCGWCADGGASTPLKPNREQA